MFDLFSRKKIVARTGNPGGRAARMLPPVELPPMLEDLEDRRLMSVTLAGHAKHASVKAHSTHLTSSLKRSSTTSTSTATTTETTGTGTTMTCGNHGASDESTTTFSDLQTSDAAAATELTTLATADSLTIASDQSIDVRTISSTTTYYSITLTPSTGTVIKLTVDQAGNPITPATTGTATFGAITATAVTSELTTLAGALNLTAPTSTTNVDVVTANGNTTYTVDLSPSSGKGRDVRISVDAAGNPVGDINIPYSALPADGVIATGLASLATPYGTTLTSTSTNTVSVRSNGTTTTYTVRLTGSGQSVSLTVDETGAAAEPVSGHDGFGFGFGDFGGGGFGRHRR